MISSQRITCLLSSTGSVVPFSRSLLTWGNNWLLSASRLWWWPKVTQGSIPDCCVMIHVWSSRWKKTCWLEERIKMERLSTRSIVLA
jgi:hypothetical protein